MKEHPIIFTGESVRSILAGSKTQTRRIACSGRGELVQFDGRTARFRDSIPDDPAPIDVKCRWQPGDVLWVRETWCCEMTGGTYSRAGFYLYRADGVEVYADDGDGGYRWRKDGSEASPWISPMRMPRKASRIDLEVLSVRVQRLQDISEDDAIAEGFDGSVTDTPTWLFHIAWDAINGKRVSWDSNPWVWAIEFKRLAEHTTHKET